MCRRLFEVSFYLLSVALTLDNSTVFPPGDSRELYTIQRSTIHFLGFYRRRPLWSARELSSYKYSGL